MKYGHLDGQGIAELRNFNIQNLSSAPTTGLKAGRFYFNTTDNTLYVYDGSTWADALSQGRIYTEGLGIDITGSEISVDTSVIAQQSDLPTKVSDLTNDSGYITGITGSDVTTALGYTPYNATNPSGYQENVIETVKVNNTALTPTSKAVNITVPTTAADVNALPSSTKYGATITASLNTTDYKLTLTLKDQDGNTLGTAQVVDFPIESVVVSGSYDNTNKKIILTLQNGTTIDVPVGDLVAGLQSEITSSNKLDADLVDDSTSTNKFVTAANKTTWNNKQDAISDLATIRSGAAKGATSVQSYNATNPALTVTGGVATWAVTHNLNNSNVAIHLYEVSSGEEVMFDRSITSANAVSVKILSTAASIAANTYKIVVQG
ncbi:MAG: hypothetical protein IJ077_08555 [Eubacterium sp.]|nr:hypothetical protein [Eubacterium sp.]